VRLQWNQEEGKASARSLKMLEPINRELGVIEVEAFKTVFVG